MISKLTIREEIYANDIDFKNFIASPVNDSDYDYRKELYLVIIQP